MVRFCLLFSSLMILSKWFYSALGNDGCIISSQLTVIRQRRQCVHLPFPLDQVQNLTFSRGGWKGK